MEKVLETELLLTKIDKKTHKGIFFYIEKEMNQLKIELQYSPKLVVERENILEAFEENKCDMNLEEASLFLKKYLKGEEKLKNLVTLSLYNEKEYIGCAHRSLDEQTILISREESSPGFKNTKVIDGQWEIVLSMHGVNSSNMNISLKAYAE